MLFLEMGEKKKVVENVTILIEQHTMSVNENNTHMLFLVTGWKHRGEGKTRGEAGILQQGAIGFQTGA